MSSIGKTRYQGEYHHQNKKEYKQPYKIPLCCPADMTGTLFSPAFPADPSAVNHNNPPKAYSS
jgi:hypothetical protein